MRMHTKVVAGLMLLGAMAMSASANTVKINWGYDDVPPVSATAKIYNGATLTETFQTFCLEANEYFSEGRSYNYTLDAEVIHGGGTSGSKALSTGAALLYEAYINHAISNAKAVQEAVWYYQGYSGYTDSTGYFSGYTKAQLQAAYSGSYLVINLTDTANSDGLNNYKQNGIYGDRQSFIYSVPEGSVTVSLLGFGLIGLGMLRRKLA